MEFIAPAVISDIIVQHRLQKRDPDAVDLINPYSHVQPSFLGDSGFRRWFGILAIETVKSQSKTPYNIMVRDNRRMLASMAGITAAHHYLYWPSHPRTSLIDFFTVYLLSQQKRSWLYAGYHLN